MESERELATPSSPSSRGSGWARAYRILLLLPFALPVGPSSAAGEEAARDPASQTDGPGPDSVFGYRIPGIGWGANLSGGAVHQFKTGLDQGGDFGVTRVYVRPAVRRLLTPELHVGLSFGYGYDSYRFSGGGFAALKPWDQVQRMRVSLPMRWQPAPRWNLYLIPTLRWKAERISDLGDGMSGGALMGFSYRFGERLTIGPGIGILSRIAGSVRVFPVILIDWKILDRLRLRTGTGIGATAGPGLRLEWKPTPPWTFSVGARLERLRFRLDDSSQIAPNGVGQDKSIPVLASVAYRFNRNVIVALAGGVELDGKLRIRDSNGNKLVSSSYDPAGYIGLTFRIRP